MAEEWPFPANSDQTQSEWGLVCTSLEKCLQLNRKGIKMLSYDVFATRHYSVQVQYKSTSTSVKTLIELSGFHHNAVNKN